MEKQLRFMKGNIACLKFELINDGEFIPLSVKEIGFEFNVAGQETVKTDYACHGIGYEVVLGFNDEDLVSLEDAKEIMTGNVIKQIASKLNKLVEMDQPAG